MTVADDTIQALTTQNLEDSHAASFRFVQLLAGELSKGKVDLPSFPDIVARIRKVLEDEKVRPEQVIRVVSSEPALAARVMNIANSAALNVTGKPVTDLPTAVSRMGFNMVRSAAIAFALCQLKNAEALKDLQKPLMTLWESSTSVAAMAHVLARRSATVNPDTALLAGLLHEVGKLYILTRTRQHPELLADMSNYRAIVRDWHANIAKALLDNWKVPEEIGAAIGDYENLAREHRGATDLTDILTLASLLTAFRAHPETMAVKLQAIGAAKRFKLAPMTWGQLLEESANEVAEMKRVLGH